MKIHLQNSAFLGNINPFMMIGILPCLALVSNATDRKPDFGQAIRHLESIRGGGAKESFEKNLRDLRLEMSREMQGLQSPLADLRTMTPKYAGADPETLADTRRDLREKLAAGHERIWQLQRRFMDVRKTYNLQQGALIFSKMARARSDASVARNLDGMLDFGDLDDLLSFRKTLDKVMAEDEAAFAAAEREHAERLHVRVLVGGAFACAFALAWAKWRFG